ncbi:MAG TPA: protein-disulfide reductase DsbD family protein [Chitinophagaceae bacterium]|nr:protein-disulfide reductase DsbD N-terminal domain-containing protein [Chitinophagaceae bacterium]MCC6636012.1 sugar transporter [Chitinophagaceae bacterium]HMZ46045.1 protein-disulfide reductase DsbD family protein [Chitinophagaceae bacterium]HNE93749.1 protein-disulfide reductase DsbD family protein [Chitinophagaceae bacterium]HNF29219.1 protein-disulfide reductase DsbD family protein [Chitinophagaceae bacterium]
MKNLILVLAGVIFTFSVQAQKAKNPVSFSYKAVKKTDGTVDIIALATIEKGWHIYSQNTDKGGPVPTNIAFKLNPLAKKTGKVLEKGKVEKTFDKTFGVNVMYYSNQVQFIQNFKIKNGIKTSIYGTVEYMVCDDEMCLPPKKENFEVKI